MLASTVLFPCLHKARTTLRLIVAAAALTPSASQAADRIWTGATDVAYTNGANWASGVAPANNDYSDRALFRENAPTNRTPTLYANRTVNAVRFENSVGWQVAGSGTFMMKTFYSTGIGTNTIAPQMKNAAAGPWTIGTNCTAVFSGGLYIDNSDLTFNGGGTVVIPSVIDGWRAGRKMYVSNGTVRVAASSPTGTAGTNIISGVNGRIQIKNTVAGAKALIGTRIVDGVGRGLDVLDIGGGYVEVHVAAKGTVFSAY